MLVVAPSDNLILAEPENLPDADLFADDIAVLDLGMEDFRCGRRIQSSKRGNLVARDQKQLHPPRMMGENGEEDVDDAELPAAQWHPVGVTEIGVLHRLAIQHATGLHLAFNNVHAKLPTWRTACPLPS